MKYCNTLNEKTINNSLPLLVFALSLTVILLSACTKNPVNADTTITATGSSPTEIAEEAAVLEQTPTTEPAQPVKKIMLDLPVIASENDKLLSPGDEEGVFHVNFEDGLPSENQLWNDSPAMPAYIWYFNGDEADAIDSIVIEFDLLETEKALDPLTFGYDRGFFIGMNNFDTIPIIPPWVDGDEVLADFQEFSDQRGGDTDRDVFLRIPELAVDLQRYVEQNAQHIRIAIPYYEFQNAAKNLTLQFLPGTTFGNLTATLFCEEGLDLDKIIEPITDFGTTDILHDEIVPILNISLDISEEGLINPETKPGSMNYGRPFLHDALVINSDGSINMPVSMYDLGAYAFEVQGDYAVIPEGLVSVFLTLATDGFSNEERRPVIEFALNMIDETGRISGVYDIEQQKMVAAERKVSALPVLSAMLYHYYHYGILSDAEIDRIMNSIINYQIVRIGDQLYYAPNGISADGIMYLNLSDMIISDQLILYLAENYSVNSNGRLDEKYGASIFLEGFANSMELILEAQEQNPTRLPSTDVKIIFHEDSSYHLQPSEVFSINNSYFSTWLVYYSQFHNIVNEFQGGNIPAMNNLIKSVQSRPDGTYPEYQESLIRETMAMYSERYNTYRIVNTYYKSCLDIYNFIKIQPSLSIYASAYNAITGEMIYDDSGQFASPSESFETIRARFGSPAASLNWLNLVGMFNDEEMSVEAWKVNVINYDMYAAWIFASPHLEYSNPDLYLENSFNVWGFDAQRNGLINNPTAMVPTYFLYNQSGMSFDREDWREYTLRKLNENRSEEQALTLDSVVPFFYDHIPGITIETCSEKTLNTNNQH